ncbi:MAG: acyltransferase [Chlorobium sp.]|nr:acyltransferase [Chlorobium sp.]
MINKFINKYQTWKAYRSSDNYIAWLRSKGIKIGKNCRVWSPKTVAIDLTRPSLIDIGDNVYITANCTLLTHGYDWAVLRNLYGEVFCSSGKVVIENNVFIGRHTIILKGVTIGSNSIIGAGSVVTRSIPTGTVAGNPARVICSIEEYYKKRKQHYIEEAKEYARSIKTRFGRIPCQEEFAEEFPLFVSGKELPHVSVVFQKQLKGAYEHYCKKHESIYSSFEEFLKDAGAL